MKEKPEHAGATSQAEVLAVGLPSDVLARVQEILETDGHRVAGAPTASEALAAAGARPPRMLLAWQDPHLVRTLQEQARFEAVPVLLLGTADAPEARREGLRSGAADCVPLPLLPEELRARAGAWLALATAREELENERTRTRNRDLERDRLYAAIMQASESIVITDLDGTILFVNPAFEETTGYSRDEVVGQNPRLLNSGRQDPSFYQGMWDTLLAGRVWKGHFFNRRKDGTVFEEEANITPVLGEDGSIQAYVAVKRDVTWERMLDRQVRQSRKMEAVGNLAAGIAHDFNNLLTPILGYAELLSAELGPDAEAPEEIRKMALRGRDLTRRILALGRPSTGDVHPISPRRVLEDAQRFLRVSIPAQVDLRMQLQDTGLVNIDPSDLYRVVLNLCTNAWQAFGPSQGTIEVSLSRRTLRPGLQLRSPLPPGRYVLISVTDDGPGIPAHLHESIFDPYFTTRRDENGAGLGLTLAEGIVRRAGGAVTVVSTPGRGSRFEVLLPEHAAGPLKDEEAPGEASRSPGDGRVLVVDDEEVVARLLCRMLTRLGYTAEATTDPHEALVRMDEGASYDLLLTDLSIPEMSGLELVRSLRQQGRDIPTLVLTGLNDAVTPEEAKRLGISQVLLKPVTLQALSEALAAALERS